MLLAAIDLGTHPFPGKNSQTSSARPAVRMQSGRAELSRNFGPAMFPIPIPRGPRAQSSIFAGAATSELRRGSNARP